MRAEHSRLLALLLCAATLAAAEPAYHILEKGETLYSIARKYNVPFEVLAKANEVTDPTKIKAGQKLLIPQLHRVAKGETLFGIARHYGVSVESLREANRLDSKALLKAGDTLFIPSAATPSGTAATGIGTTPASTPVVPMPTDGSGTLASSSGKTSGAESPVPLPAPVKTSARPVDPSITWPCPGEALYLDGKLFGVMFRAEKGSAAKAVASGTIVSAGAYRGFGEVAFVQGKTGHIYVYGGFESLAVRVGEAVRNGQELGRIGFDAKEARPLGYFFVFKEGVAIDPALAPRN